MPEPKTFLHHASAEVKQLWTVVALMLMARATAPVRLAIAAVLVAATVAALPRRLCKPQLVRLGGLCAVLFFFTLIGALGWALQCSTVPSSIPLSEPLPRGLTTRQSPHPRTSCPRPPPAQAPRACRLC